jgi:ketosteroid isomerase-like protein
MTAAREVFDRFRDNLLSEARFETWAADVVVEQPFAAGGPSRVEGRDTFLALTKTSRESLPVRIEEMRNVVVHESTDPNKIVVEYELAGVVLTTGKRASALFVVVMEVRDGLMTLWREYQNTLAMAKELGPLPGMDTDFEKVTG